LWFSGSHVPLLHPSIFNLHSFFFWKTHLLPYIIRFHGKDFLSTLINTFLIVYAENELSILNFNSVSNFQHKQLPIWVPGCFHLLKKPIEICLWGTYTACNLYNQIFWETLKSEFLFWRNKLLLT